ncbi:MAG: flagellar biosynthesis protein FlhB [Deltaproteobacteria bacterium]
MADPSRTEAATPKRRSEEREKGNVPKSREIPAVAVLLGGSGVLYFTSGHMMGGLTSVFRDFLAVTPSRVNSVAGVHTLLADVFARCGFLLLPTFAGTVFFAAASNLAQTGFLFTAEPLRPKFDKLNPVAGLRRLFSPQSLAELLKAIVKFAVVGFAAWRVIRGQLPFLPEIIEKTPEEIVLYFLRVGGSILLQCGIPLLLLAAGDYAFQRWSWEKSIRMTKEEVKEEFRQQEGDPAVKSRIRSLQREKARRRILQEVPKADVVITNPTHFSVALRYERGSAAAPRVLVKGADLMALRIREVAKESGVPVVERPPLARALYAGVEEGQEIPLETYQAVAEVLAYVYRLRDRNLAV